MILQSPSPKPDSIRAKLTSHSGDEGIAAFYTNGIPYSLTSSLGMATRLAPIFDTVNRQESSSFVIQEWGGGMGLLCRHLMDVFQASYSSLYDKTFYRISDISAAHLANVKAGGALDAHHERVALMVEDALKPSVQDPADVVVMTYLIDALPAHVIRVDGRQLSEMYVQTEVPDTHLFIDTRTFPFELKATPHIAIEWAQQEALPPALAYQLAKAMQETYVSRPLTFSEKETALIRAFVDSMPMSSSPWVWHFHPGLVRLFESWATSLKPGGAVLILDFGFFQPVQDPASLTRAYGQQAFSGLCFPFLFFLCRQYGFDYVTTDYPEGGTQVILLVKGQMTTQTKAAFKAQFATSFFQSCRQARDLMDDVLDNPKVTAKLGLKRIWDTLVPVDREDVFLLQQAAAICLSKGDTPYAIELLRKAYRQVHRSGLLTLALLGQCMMQLGQLGRSRHYLNQALQLSPDYPDALLQCALLDYKEKNYEGFLRASKAYLHVSRVPIWSHLNVMLGAAIQYQDRETQEEIVRTFSQYSDYLKKMMPEQVYHVFNQLKEMTKEKV